MRGRPKDLPAAYAVSRRLAESNSLNNFAISSTGIGDALQRSAAALFAAGNTMEQSIGMITAMNAVIQNPESVGTTLKTLTMYLRAAKTEAEAAGEETDGMAESVAKLREELLTLTNNKVDIMIDDDTFKSTYQIVKELAGVWGELTDVTQANILNLVGGKRNANSISALIENFEDAEKASIAAANSMGSAYAENQNYLDSISGKLTQIQTTFESISNNVINSGVAKFLLDVVHSLLQVVEFLSKIGALIPVITGGLMLVKSLNLTNAVNAIAKQAKILGNTADTAKQIAASVSSFNGSQFKRLLETLDANGLNNVAAELRNVSSTLDDVADKAGETGKSFQKSSKLAISSVGGWISVILSLVSVAFAAYDGFKQHEQQAIQASHDLVNAMADAKDEYDSNISSIQSLSDRYYELTKKMKENGGQAALSKEEYDEYHSIVNQILDISPTLVERYGAEGQALSEYTDLIVAATEAQNNWLDSRVNETFTTENSKSIFKTAAKEYKLEMRELKNAHADMLSHLIDGFNADMAYAYKAYLVDVGALDWGTIMDWNDPTAYVDILMQDFDALIDYLNNTPVFEGMETRIAQGLQGIKSAAENVQGAVKPVFDYLINWDKYMDVDPKDINEHVNLSELDADLYDDALDVIRGVAEEAAKTAMSSTEAIDLMYVSLQQLDQATKNSAVADYMYQLIDCLEAGTASWATFDGALDIFRKRLLELGMSEYVADSAVDFFYELADAAVVAENSVGSAGNKIEASYTDIGEYLGKVSEYATLNAQALREIDENGRLSLETVQKFMDSGLGDLLQTGAKFKAGKRVDSWYFYSEAAFKNYIQQLGEAKNVTAEAVATANEFWEAAKADDDAVSPITEAIKTAKEYADLNALALKNLSDDDLSNDIEVELAFREAFNDEQFNALMKQVGERWEYDEQKLRALTQQLLNTNEVFGASEKNVWDYWEAQKAVEEVGGDTDVFEKFARLADLNAKAMADMAAGQHINYDTYQDFLGEEVLADHLGSIFTFDGGLPKYAEGAEALMKSIADGIAAVGSEADKVKPMMDDYWESVKATAEPIDGIGAALTINSAISSAMDDIREYGAVTAETLSSIKDDFAEIGLNYEDYFYGNSAGVTGVLITALEKAQQAFLDTANAEAAMRQSIERDLNAIFAGEELALNDAAMTAYNSAQSAIDLLTQANLDLNSELAAVSDTTAGNFAEFFGVDAFEQYLVKSEELGKYTDVNTEAIRKYIDSVYEGIDGVESLYDISVSAFDTALVSGTVDEVERYIELLGQIGSQADAIATAYAEAQENQGYVGLNAATSLINAFGRDAVVEAQMADGSIGWQLASTEKLRELMIQKLGDDEIGLALVGVVDSALNEIYNKADDTFTKLTNALSGASGRTSLIAQVKKEMETAGKVSFDTMLDMYETYGEEAAGLMANVVKRSSGEVIDQYAVIDYQQLIDYELAALRAAGANEIWIASYEEYLQAALKGEEIKSPFETLTEGMDKAKSYMSSVEGAYGDVLESGSLTFDTLSDLMDTFGEDWMDVVDLDETTGQFEILTDKVKELAVEQLRASNASEEVIAAYERQYDAALKAVEESQKEAEIKARITVETEGFTNVIAAVKESTSATGIGLESIDKLVERYRGLSDVNGTLPTLFEMTANGIHLNVQAMRELESEYEATKVKEYTDELETLWEQYEALNEQIEAGGSVELYAQRDDILNQMRDVATLKAQYEGLTSAYNKWMEASSGPEEGDMYDSVRESIAGAKELRDAGLVGTNEFRAAAEFITGLDADTVSLDTLVAEFDKAYPIMQKYFTEGDKGAKNFVDDIISINDEMGEIDGNWQSWVKRDEDGNFLGFENIDTELLADKMGVGVEVVEAALRKLSDYGWDVDFSPVDKRLEELRYSAEDANKALHEMDESTPQFNFDTTSLERAEEQIQQANTEFEKYRNEDGTWNLDIEGASEAREILVALIKQRQELEQPMLMDVQAQNISGDLGETLRTLQQIQQLSGQLEVENAAGEDTTKTTEELEALRQKLVALSETNPEILKGLGIEDLTTVQSIVTAIGEIPAEKLVSIGVDPALIDGYMAETITKDATVIWHNDTLEVDVYRDMKITKSATVKWKNDYSAVSAPDGAGGVDGTAHVDGTAMADGYWGTKKSGKALMGELGPELVNE